MLHTDTERHRNTHRRRHRHRERERDKYTGTKPNTHVHARMNTQQRKLDIRTNAQAVPVVKITDFGESAWLPRESHPQSLDSSGSMAAAAQA